MNDDDRYIIDTEEDKAEMKSQTSTNRFPVKTQFILILFILGGLFAGIIVPKTVALFSSEQVTQKAEVSAVEVKTENGEALQKIESVNIRAKSAYVWDVKEQRLLFQKKSDVVLPLASITKLMTALVAYELVPDDTLAEVTEMAASQQSGGSLKTGEVFKVKELADFALVSSYNSAAYTLANSVGSKLGDKDPVEQFVAGMNIRAKELKLDSLKFINPTGLDVSESEAGAYGTARDVTFLMEYILTKHPEILRPTISDSTRLFNQSGDHHDAKNTNEIVNKIPNLIGSKTGYTDLAGGNLTVALDIGFEHPVVITVLGSTIDERFSDVDKLIKAVQSTVINQE